MDASRARASDAPVVDRAFARADIVERPPRASSRLLLVVVVARPSSADVDRVLARALASRGTNERTNDERRRRRSNDRSNARDPPDIIFLRASTARATRHSRRRARPRGIHPSIHSRAIGPTLARIESNRDRAHLLFLGRLRGARDDDASGASSGVRGRVDRARLARVRDRSSRREHRRCLPPSRARRAATGPRRSRS